MKQATFNDFINLKYPDDFQLLSKEESKKVFKQFVNSFHL